MTPQRFRLKRNNGCPPISLLLLRLVHFLFWFQRSSTPSGTQTRRVVLRAPRLAQSLQPVRRDTQRSTSTNHAPTAQRIIARDAVTGAHVLSVTMSSLDVHRQRLRRRPTQRSNALVSWSSKRVVLFFSSQIFQVDFVFCLQQGELSQLCSGCSCI